MLETIRQFTEEQLVQCGGAGRVRGAHARYFAGKEAEVLAIWDGPRQREAYEWFGVEAANLRSAFRWAADNDDIDTAATIAFYGAFLGSCLGQLEGVAWAEELIEPAKASRHPRLVQLYGVAIQCYQFGRVDDSIRYAEEAEAAIASGEFAGVPTRTEATLGIGYITAGKPERLAELSRRTIAREPKTNPFSLACLVNALTIAGDFEQAKAKSEEMLIAANDEANPARIVHALLAYGFANTNSNPEKAYEVLRRALVLSRSSGNRDSETHLATLLSRLAPRYGTFTDALEYFTIAMRGFYDAGSFSLMPSPIAILAAFLDQLGQHESAATLCGCAMNLLTPKAFPEFNTATEHLRSVLGDDRYEALAREGAAMTNTEMANYAFEQIDIARAQLSQTAGS